jgi:phosphate acetyltransferase
VAHNLYITAMEPGSGKSIVALGLMETLAGRSEAAGFFRPIVSGPGDPQLQLIRERFALQPPVEEMFALSADDAQRMIAAGAHAELEQRVFESYRRLEERFEVVVCEGTDFTGVTPALDFDLNAMLAKALGCPVLVVVRGGSVPCIASAVRVARASLTQRGCTLFGVIVSRVPPALMAEMRAHSVVYDPGQPMYVLAESPVLEHPSVGQVAAELGAGVAPGAPADALQQEVREVRVAAMGVEHFLADLADGMLVIVPGDRADILLACLATSRAPNLPSISGLVLTGDYEAAPAMRALLAEAPFAVLSAPGRTYPTAVAVQAVVPTLAAGEARKIAAALGVFEAGVDPAELAARIALPQVATRTPMMFQYELLERARAARRRIVLPEGEDERVLQAAEILLRRDVVDLTILGPIEAVRAAAAARGISLEGAELVDPASSPLRADFAERYYELRKHKGMTPELALDAVSEGSYFGTLLVHTGGADGMVSGAAHTTADTIRPAFEIIKSRPGVSVVSSVFFMCLADRVLVYGDCAVNPQPNSEQLADIAISSAATAAGFGIDVRVAMLSYSTGSSGSGAQVDIVRSAAEIVRERAPSLRVEGPIQYDAAVDTAVAALKLPGSEVAGRATVFIFPDLDTGNVAYKAVQRSAGALAIGPVLQGLNKPINDLSRGCTVPDIVNTIAITAIQAQQLS